MNLMNLSAHRKLRAVRAYLALSGVICLFVGANLLWMKNDQAPPMWDQSQYLFSSDILYHTLTSKGLISFADAFTRALQIKAPLITILPIPFYAVGGDNYCSALIVNLVFIAIGGYYLFRLVTLVFGKKGALLSVFIFNLFPLIFAMSREFLVEYGLTVFVIVWMYYLLKSHYFEDKKCVYSLGIVLGLGMLMKVTFALFILVPTLFIIIRRIADLKGLPKALLINIAITFVTGLLISGPWYFRNLKFIMQFAISGGYGKIAKYYGMGDVFSLKTILNYWLYVINNGVSSYLFFLAVFLLLYKVILLVINRPSSSIERRGFYCLVLWFVVPFAVLSFGVNKDYRYLAPAYPALAILISSGLTSLSSRRYGKIFLIASLFFPVFNYLYISFPSKPIYFNIRAFEVLKKNLGYAHPPVKEDWPNKELVRFIHNDSLKTNIARPRITLLFNHHYLNFMNLSYYSINFGFDTTFDTANFLSREDPERTAARIERDSNYILTKSDQLGPDFTNTQNIRMVALLRAGRLRFKEIGSIPLPDKTFLTIYKKRSNEYGPYSDIGEMKRRYRLNGNSSVNFADKIKLLDYRISKGGAGYRVILFWECLDVIDRDYKIFVHIRNVNGDPVLNADHFPGNIRHPTYDWKRGEVIRDEFNIQEPLAGDFRVYVGIYEESTMSRLLVNDKPADDPVNILGVRIY
jgi:hypothetical protein